MHFISSGDISRLRFAILKVLTLTNLQVCCWLLFCTNSARNCSNPRKHRTRSTLFLHLQLFVTSCSAEPLYCAPLKTLRHRALDPSMSHSHLYIGWMRVFQRFLEHFFSILVHLVISPRGGGIKQPLQLMFSKLRRGIYATGMRKLSSIAKVWVDKNTKVICQGFTGMFRF